jgi:hypothetical protein
MPPCRIGAFEIALLATSRLARNVRFCAAALPQVAIAKTLAVCSPGDRAHNHASGPANWRGLTRRENGGDDVATRARVEPARVLGLRLGWSASPAEAGDEGP